MSNKFKVNDIVYKYWVYDNFTSGINFRIQPTTPVDFTIHRCVIVEINDNEVVLRDLDANSEFAYGDLTVPDIFKTKREACDAVKADIDHIIDRHNTYISVCKSVLNVLKDISES